MNNPLSLLPRLPEDRWSEAPRGVRREQSSYDPLTGQVITERTLHSRDGRKIRLPTRRVRLYAPHELAHARRDPRAPGMGATLQILEEVPLEACSVASCDS